MRSRRALVLSSLASSIMTVAVARAQPPAATPAPATGMSMPAPMVPAGPPPLYGNLGTWHRAITTRVPRAQAYFDQGLRLLYGFNLEEAQRAFTEATRLDAKCAMCWWGVGMSLGPHLNLGATPERTAAAYVATQHAVALAAHGSPVEQALIAALARRYAAEMPSDPGAEHALEAAYADAMRAAAKQFPDDGDVSTLAAEALMDLRPWDLWTNGGVPQPGTQEILALLEQALARHPDNPGANHYYIHATEASPHPERAFEAATRLGGMDLAGAGHLVHMPSHTYMRMGRYEDAAQVNRLAIQADDSYVAAQHPQGFYVMYVAHNHQFLWAAALMEGRSAEALQAARQVEAIVPLDMLRQMPGFDFTLLYPTYTLLRFGRWDDVLAEPAPPQDFPCATALWHAARATALAGKKDVEAANAELQQLRDWSAKVPADAPEGLNKAHDLLAIAEGMAAGATALAAGKNEDGIAVLGKAVAAEDALHYDEPSDWYFPLRPVLGEALLAAGHAAEAGGVFNQDLAQNPDNGWSLFGLWRVYNALQDRRNAILTSRRFAEVWTRADVQLAPGWSTVPKRPGAP